MKKSVPGGLFLPPSSSRDHHLVRPSSATPGVTQTTPPPCLCVWEGRPFLSSRPPSSHRPPPPSRLVAVVRGPPPRRKPKWGSISIRSDSGASGAAWRRCHSRVAVLKSAAAAGTMSLVMMAMVGKMWLPRLPGGLCVWRPGPPPREATAV